MSGHSKWHSIKHKKAVTDAKRGRTFTRLIKEITVAARSGGGDPDANARLRKAVSDAKAMNMPADNIKRAIQKGTGELEGSHLEEITFEGYGPGGVAVLVDGVTDNRNRTVGDIRHVFSKYGGNLGETGCVAWMFQRKGYILVNSALSDEETLMALAVESGANDFAIHGQDYEITTTPEAFDTVLTAVKNKGIAPATAEVSMVPQTYVRLEGRTAQQMLKLMDALDEHDDVQQVFANFDIMEAELAEVT